MQAPASAERGLPLPVVASRTAIISPRLHVFSWRWKMNTPSGLMPKVKMCPNCRAFIDPSHKTCEYCGSEVGARKWEPAPSSALSGLIPQDNFTTIILLVVNFGLFIVQPDRDIAVIGRDPAFVKDVLSDVDNILPILSFCFHHANSVSYRVRQAAVKKNRAFRLRHLSWQ